MYTLLWCPNVGYFHYPGFSLKLDTLTVQFIEGALFITVSCLNLCSNSTLWLHVKQRWKQIKVLTWHNNFNNVYCECVEVSNQRNGITTLSWPIRFFFSYLFDIKNISILPEAFFTFTSKSSFVPVHDTRCGRSFHIGSWQVVSCVNGNFWTKFIEVFLHT